MTEFLSDDPTLEQYWAAHRGGLGPAGLADLLARVARDLAAAHRAFAPGVLVHGNLSPRNILVVPGADPRAVVLMFGLSQVRYPDGSPGLGSAGPGGASGYMPPEQMATGARGAGGLTPQADVYSLGAVLYQLLTGELPAVTGADSVEMAEAMRNTAFRPPGAFAPRLAPFDPICRGALAHRPEDRYPSMDEFAADLATFGASDAPLRPSAEEGAPAPAESASPPPAPTGGRFRHVRVADEGDVAVVTFVRRKLLDETQQVEAELLRVVNELGRQNVLLDLSGLESVWGAGLAACVDLHHRLLAAGGRLVICGASTDVLRPLQARAGGRVLFLAPTKRDGLRRFEPYPSRVFPHFAVEDRGDVAVAKFAGGKPLEPDDVDRVFASLIELFDRAERHRVLLNLLALKTVSRRFCGKVVALHNKLAAGGGRLIVCAKGAVREQFELLRLEEAFTITSDAQEAFRLF